MIKTHHLQRRILLVLFLFQGLALMSFAQNQSKSWGNPDSLRRILQADEDTAMRARYQAFVQVARKNPSLPAKQAALDSFIARNAGNLAGVYAFTSTWADTSYTHLDSLYRLFTPAMDSTGTMRLMRRLVDGRRTLSPGMPAPPLEGRTSDGRPFHLSDLRGKWVLLDFWGSWCGPCVAGFPALKDLLQRHKDKLVIVGIDCKETEAAWRAALQRYNLPWPQLRSDNVVTGEHRGAGTTTTDYNTRFLVAQFPTKWLIDPTGRLTQIFTGEDPVAYAAIDSLLASRPQ